MSNSLSSDITTEELMRMDYRYSFSESELFADWKKLQETTSFKSGAQFKPGMKLCQHFMNNFWHIENDKGLSFDKCWKSYEVMDKVRVWGLKGMSKLWLSWIRRAVYMCGGLANSSFYRPHLSRQICMMHGSSSGHVFDPCAGWGGRMLGAASLGWKYTAYEPNKETYENLVRIVDFLNLKNITLYNKPVQFSEIEKDKYDVVVTSPPYFNLEKYTAEDTQSYVQFNTYEKWKECWYVPLMQTSIDSLRTDGISAWNVMDFKKHDLVDTMIHTHETAKWKMKKTIGFDSPLANIRKLKNKDVTYVWIR